MKRSKFWTIPLHVLVAIPASIPGRNVRVASDIHERMTIAAVEAQLVDMDLVRKRNRLCGLVPYAERFRCGVVAEGETDACRYRTRTNNDFKGQNIGPTRKDVCHGELAMR